VEKHGIRYHEKHKGQLFCDGSAREMVAMLEQECSAGGVKVVVNAGVREVRRADDFAVLAGDDEFSCAGARDRDGRIVDPQDWGHCFRIRSRAAVRDQAPTVSACVGAAAVGGNDRAVYSDLSGVSTEVVASCDGQEFRDKMLITHRGLSGPAILQISSYWQKPAAISLDLAPDGEWTSGLRQAQGRRDLNAAKAALRQVIPQRLADRWLEKHPPADWTNASMDAMERSSHRWKIAPAGTEGYEKAEVTAGVWIRTSCRQRAWRAGKFRACSLLERWAM